MRAAALAILLVALPVWTVLLLVPNPVPTPVRALLGFWEHALFVAAKATHAGCYAFLACAAVVAFGRRRAGWVVLVLVLHGAATECGQTLVPNRGGTVRDAAIDAAGVLAGVAVARRWSR